MSQSLYSIADNIRNLIELGKEGEVPLEAMEDTLDALTMEFDDKLDAVLAYRQGLIHEATAYNEEIKRLTDRKKSLNNKAESLKKYAVNMMFAVSKDKHKGLFSVSIGKPSKVVSIENIDLIPSEYIVVTKAPNKTALKQALNNNEQIEGATIIDGQPRITIK